MAEFLKVYGALNQPNCAACDGNCDNTIVSGRDARTLRTVNAIINCWKRFGHVRRFSLSSKKYNLSWDSISALINTEGVKYKMITHINLPFMLFNFNSFRPCLCEDLHAPSKDANSKYKN